MPHFPAARLVNWYRILRLRHAGVVLASDCRLADSLDCHLGLVSTRSGCISLGPRCHLETGVVLHAYGGEISLGKNVFIGPYAVVYGHGGVTVGDDTLVSMHCRILSSNHTIPPLDRHIRWEPDVLKPTRIGRDVWLGAGVTVLGGVTVGDGCVVAAGAVVTKDLAPGSLARGVPAVVYGMRPAAA
jgi:acetyltransferase-like isoleucine patch superfamily enzyme